MLINQIFCFIAIYLYGEHSDEASEEITNALYLVIVGLMVFSMINFGLFLKSINQDYIKTFFSTITGKQFVVQTYFEEGLTDEVKFVVFCHHSSYYRSIDGKLLKWLNDNWDRWQDEQPEWFTAQVISTVPPSMLPIKYLESIGGIKGRKASLAALKKTEEEEEKRRSFIEAADVKADV